MEPELSPAKLRLYVNLLEKLSQEECLKAGELGRVCFVKFPWLIGPICYPCQARYVKALEI